MQTDIEQLIRRRQASIATLDSIVSFTDSYVPSRSTLQRAIVRLDDLPHLYSRFDECQSRLEETDEEHTDKHIVARIAFQNKYFDLVAVLQELVGKQANTERITGTSQKSMSSGAMKLPAVPAPIFNGSLQNWTLFIDAFNAMFHNNEVLPEVQKFHYLKSCLTESASDVIKTIPTTGDNYIKAYDTLVNRYENKALIIQSHIRSLLATPKVHTASSTELHALHHHIVAHVRALEALHQPVSYWDAWLVTLICSRLDSFTVDEWQLQQATRDLPKNTEIEAFLT